MESNSNIAAVLNIIHKRGDTFTRELTVNRNGDPMDLDGYSARMDIRSENGKGSAVLTISTEDYITVLGENNNVLKITVPAELMEFPAANTYKYDIELTSPSGIVQTWIEGMFRLVQDITQ